MSNNKIKNEKKNRHKNAEWMEASYSTVWVGKQSENAEFGNLQSRAYIR